MGAAAISTTIEASVGSGLLSAARFSGPAAPFLTAAGLIADVMAAFGVGAGCGQTCIESTQFANQANAALEQNIETFFAPRMISGTYDPTIPLGISTQQAGLYNYATLWNWLVSPQACGNPALGSAGQKCISDRQAGACTWTQPASSVPPWGTPAAGACWNWFNGYRDPIANDTNVYDDSSEIQAVLNGTASSTATATSQGSAFALPPWWPLAAAALLIGVGVMR